MTTYSFTHTPIAVDRLTQEIQQSSITVALDHVNLYGAALDIVFKADLSTSEQTTLNGIVSAHSGVPLIQNIPTPVLVQNNPIVTTQYELNDKDLKLAKAMGTLDATTHQAVMYLKVPGTPGTTDGRYIAGGYAISEDYNKDDYVDVYAEDVDRIIAWGVALSINPNATAPVSDATVIAAGVIPGYGAFPQYPIIKSYTDDEADAANRGWYFWPLAMGNSAAPAGECEVEPIGGYGFMPAGFYLKLIYIRPNTLTTGSCRVNFYWGKKE